MEDETDQDSSSNTLQNDESTIVYMEKIQVERAKMKHVLNNTKSMDLRRAVPCVFQRYAIEEQALLEVLRQPENIDELLLTVDESGAEKALAEELEALVADLDRVVQNVQEMNCELETTRDRTREIVEALEIMEGLEKNNQQSINETNITKIEENIRIRFKKEKEQLKMVLNAVLPDDDDAKGMLAELIESGLKEPEAYVTFQEGGDVRERIAMLAKIGLFEADPENSLRMRMVNLT